MLNIESIYNTYVATDLIECMPTYQFSQDPLESIFGRTRSLNGDNDNPTVTQFTSSFRKILVQNEIKSFKFANCADRLRIMTISSRRQQHVNRNDMLDFDDINLQERSIQKMQMNMNDFVLDCSEDLTVSSIASAIENKIQTVARFECSSCKSVIEGNNKVSHFTMVNNNFAPPCISTVNICKIAFSCLKQYKNRINFDYKKLIHDVLELYIYNCLYTDSSFECSGDHKAYFVEFIIEEFIRIQATYIAKNLTLIERKILCRNQLRKQIHFRGL